MPSERMAPTVLLEQTNLTGAVTDIDDDPDSPDANWLTAPGSNSNTNARVSFDTPTQALDDSANAQEFRVQVRKTNHSTNPTAVVRLFVNGVDTSEVVASTTITSTTGQILAGNWTSSGIAAADVECRVVGTVGGGSPGNRASVEVGAIEWNAATSNVTSAPAGNASVSAAANAATLIIKPPGGNASISAAANAPSAKVSPLPPVATMATAANDATVQTGGSGTQAPAGSAATQAVANNVASMTIRCRPQKVG